MDFLHRAPEIGWTETPDGGRMRHARWVPDGPPRGSVVMLLGRSEFVEKYEEIAVDWTRRGFEALTFDWRGQGLSSRFGTDRRRHHLPDFDLLLDDLALYVEEVAAPAAARPRVLFGHSMGGLLAVLHLAKRPGAFDAAILSAPMLDIRTAPFPRPFARRCASLAVALGYGESYVPGQGDYDPDGIAFEANGLSQDPVRWAAQHRWLARNPDLAVGGVTWGWLDAAFRAIDALRAPGTVESIDVPVLVLSAPDDPLVVAEDHGELCGRLPRGRLRQYPDGLHELFMDRDELRDRVWADVDAFLAEALPAPGAG